MIVIPFVGKNRLFLVSLDEEKEKLEQLRAYALGLKIIVEESRTSPGPDVDTQEDLQLVNSIYKNK